MKSSIYFLLRVEMEIKEILMYVGIYIFGFISLSSCISIGVKIGLTSFLQEKQLKLEKK
jgi:hypothetical protein